MAEINIEIGFTTHRKVMRLQARIGDEADIFPIRLWEFTALHYPETGLLNGYTEAEVEKVIRWRGEPGALVQALSDPEIGFLVKTENGFIVNNFVKRQGHLSAFSKRGRKAARARWKNIEQGSGATVRAAPGKKVPAQRLMKAEDGVHEFLEWFLEKCLSLSLKAEDETKKAAAVQAYNNNRTDAEALMTAVLGELADAKRALSDIGHFHKSRGLSWNLKTVAAKAAEWRASPEDFKVTA